MLVLAGTTGAAAVCLYASMLALRFLRLRRVEDLVRRQRTAEIPEPRAYWLRHFLHTSEESMVRRNAVFGLVATHEGTLEEFRTLLDDDDDDVRVLAAYALAFRFRDEGGLAVLLALLDSGEDSVLSRAIMSFALAATGNSWNEETQEVIRKGTKKLVLLLKTSSSSRRQEWAGLALETIAKRRFFPERATGAPPFRSPTELAEARKRIEAWARETGMAEDGGATDEGASGDTNR